MSGDRDLIIPVDDEEVRKDHFELLHTAVTTTVPKIAYEASDHTSDLVVDMPLHLPHQSSHEYDNGDCSKSLRGGPNATYSGNPDPDLDGGRRSATANNQISVGEPFSLVTEIRDSGDPTDGAHSDSDEPVRQTLVPGKTHLRPTQAQMKQGDAILKAWADQDPHKYKPSCSAKQGRIPHAIFVCCHCGFAHTARNGEMFAHWKMCVDHASSWTCCVWVVPILDYAFDSYPRFMISSASQKKI